MLRCGEMMAEKTDKWIRRKVMINVSKVSNLYSNCVVLLFC